jgi:glycosyltransferase involved in cell wall biosynthesis
VVDLLQAFARVARTAPGASLDLVGDNRTYPPEDLDAAIERFGVRDRVRWHRYASEQTLRDLYRRASVFAFLSEYEGLGLTPLEAMTWGAVPVLLDTPVARESCGGAALYVPSPQREPVARALEDALFNERLRASLLDAAPAVLARYSWPSAARDTLRLIEEAAEAA